MTTPREQPWRDRPDDEAAGRLVVLSRNPIADAIEVIATAAGRVVVVVDDDEDGQGLAAISGLDLRTGDAVVLCDHDAPDAPAVLRHALGSPASYVAMMASRRRAEALLTEMALERVSGLGKLRVPAGLDLGGKAAGEIALSVVAEVVATAHGRGGGPMRER